MIEPRLFLCGGIDSPEAALAAGRKVVALDAGGEDPNVHVRLEDVAHAFLRDLSPRLTDFLDLAAYVYTADGSTVRGTEWAEEGTIEPWSRDFHFVVAVRDLAFWARADVQAALKKVLTFLSDDAYEFTFVQQARPDKGGQLYLGFSEFEEWPACDVERVLMFSGGLDSLAGAVDGARRSEHLVLVSHRPVSTLSARQTELVARLRATFPHVRVVHVPVWVNKMKNLGREHTQRTRSFLFAALGAVVAHSVRARGVRFFENGVVSINLPVADEVLRARASRTTHPVTLVDLQKLAALVLGRELTIDNPYIFKTKSEVVGTLKGGAEDLIGYTCSCAHTGFFHSKTQLHCGTCSQCIDRRIALLDADLTSHEPEGDYKTDVLTGARTETLERNIAINYARHGLELATMSDEEMAAKFNAELSRAARCFPVPRDAAKELVSMHRRHGETVARVLNDGVKQVGAELVHGKLEPSSMLALVAGQKHLESSWKTFAERLVGILAAGLPPMCTKKKPADEPALQMLCDGLLKGHELNLRREYPFLAWGWSMTKPDWSNEPLRLWVELKYISAGSPSTTTASSCSACRPTPQSSTASRASGR